MNGVLDGIRYNVPSHDVKVHQQSYDKNTIKLPFFFSKDLRRSLFAVARQLIGSQY